MRLSPGHRLVLSTETVHAVHLSPPGFLVESGGYTAAALIFTPLVVIGQSMEGNAVRAGLGLEDPAARVKERVLAALEERYRLPGLKRVSQPVSSAGAEDYYSRLSGVLFEVRTTAWGINNNRAKYAAGVRVRRLSDGVSLWEATCNLILGAADATFEDLQTDNGAQLKARFAQAADACAEELADWALERAGKRQP